MAKPSNVNLVKNFLAKIETKENAETFAPQTSKNTLDTKHIFADNIVPDAFEQRHKCLDEPASALLPKKSFSSHHSLGLSIIKMKSQAPLECFSTIYSESYTDEPVFASLAKKGKKLFEEGPESEYFGYYERADTFLDENDVRFVEPDAETKIRKHIKVLSRTQSLGDQNLDSPVLAASPSLRKISDSSLLARRTNSNTQSPLSQKSTVGENSPLSMSKTSSFNHTSPIPQKISKFGENSRRNSIDSGIFEEEKLEFNFHVPPKIETLKARSKQINAIFANDHPTIQEVTEPTTPLIDPLLWNNSACGSFSNFELSAQTNADGEK